MIKYMKNLPRTALLFIVAGCAPAVEPVTCLSAPVGYVVEDKWSPYDVCPPAAVVVPFISAVPGSAGEDNSSDRQSDGNVPKEKPAEKPPAKEPPAPARQPEAQSSAAIAGQGAAAVEVRNGVVQTSRTGGGRGATATDGDVSISANAEDLLR